MKNLSIQFMILLVITLFTSCGKEYSITELNISLDKNTILDDNIDVATVNVLDQNGNNITSDINIYAGGNLIPGPDIRSSQTGTIEVYAGYQDIVSSTSVINCCRRCRLKI